MDNKTITIKGLKYETGRSNKENISVSYDFDNRDDKRDALKAIQFIINLEASFRHWKGEEFDIVFVEKE